MELFYILMFAPLSGHCYAGHDHADHDHSIHCNFIMEEDFGQCGNRQHEQARYRNLKKNRIYNESTMDDLQCSDANYGRRLYKLGLVRKQSLALQMLAELSDLFSRCCGKCTRYMRYNINVPLSQANTTFLKEMDIIYPVSARDKLVNEIHGFWFIPVFDIPEAFYFTRLLSSSEKSWHMIVQILSMWPLMVRCLILSLIAGFIAWILETWNNEKEFPRPFHIGLWEGFWWAFVSATTVGYGDKTPKSFLARLFSVVWILAGITITAIIVARMTEAVTTDHEVKRESILGKRVGVLKNLVHYSMIAAQHGGRVRKVGYNSTVSGIATMIGMMERDEIDGFLLGRTTYYYYARLIKTKKYESYNERVKHVKLKRDIFHFRGNNLAMGFLVTNKDDYEFFNKYFENNWLQVQGCFLSVQNYKDDLYKRESSDMYMGGFYLFLQYSSIILVGIIFFGIFYEVKRRSKCSEDSNSRLMDNYGK